LISFRYHLVSIVAVFLALAVGVLMGATVIKPALIEQLKGQADAAAKSASDNRKAVIELQGDLAIWRELGNAIKPMLISDKLSGSQVVVVTMDGVDVSEIDAVRQTLKDSGASVVAELVASSRMALADDRSREDLAALLGLKPQAGTPDPPDQLSEQAGTALGKRLAEGPPTQGDDLLQQLITGRFLGLQHGTVTTPGLVGGPDQAVVILSGGSGQPQFDPGPLLKPLAAALVEEGHPTAAAEGVAAEKPFVSLLRGDGTLDHHLVTVDDVDTMPGQVALILALRNLLDSPGSGGDYGVKDGVPLLPDLSG
jgi:hypothetical protein